MTNERLAELEALAEKATPGPWLSARERDDPDDPDVGTVVDHEGCDVWPWLNEDDMKLAYASRTAIPELIAALREYVAHEAHIEAAWFECEGVDGVTVRPTRKNLFESNVELREQVTALEARVRELTEWHAKVVHERDSTERDLEKAEARVKALQAAGEKLREQTTLLGSAADYDAAKAWDSAVKGS